MHRRVAMLVEVYLRNSAPLTSLKNLNPRCTVHSKEMHAPKDHQSTPDPSQRSKDLEVHYSNLMGTNAADSTQRQTTDTRCQVSVEYKRARTSTHRPGSYTHRDILRRQAGQMGLSMPLPRTNQPCVNPPKRRNNIDAFPKSR